MRASTARTLLLGAAAVAATGFLVSILLVAVTALDPSAPVRTIAACEAFALFSALLLAVVIAAQILMQISFWIAMVAGRTRELADRVGPRGSTVCHDIAAVRDRIDTLANIVNLRIYEAQNALAVLRMAEPRSAADPSTLEAVSRTYRERLQALINDHHAAIQEIACTRTTTR